MRRAGWRCTKVVPLPDLNGICMQIDNMTTEIRTARARIAKLEAYVRDVSTQKTMDEMTHQEGLRADWEGGWDTLIERAREALTP